MRGVACFETATTTKDDRQHTQLLVVGERGMTQRAVPLPRQLVLVCLAAAVRALVVSMVHDGAAGKDTAREVGVAGGAGGPPVSHSGAALAVGAGDGACGRVNRRVGGKDGQRQLRVLLQCSKPEHTHTNEAGVSNKATVSEDCHHTNAPRVHPRTSLAGSQA